MSGPPYCTGRESNPPTALAHPLSAGVFTPFFYEHSVFLQPPAVHGAESGIRTRNLMITNQLLYR